MSSEKPSAIAALRALRDELRERRRPLANFRDRRRPIPGSSLKIGPCASGRGSLDRSNPPWRGMAVV